MDNSTTEAMLPQQHHTDALVSVDENKGTI
jgi:hypothetical protein